MHESISRAYILRPQTEEGKTNDKRKAYEFIIKYSQCISPSDIPLEYAEKRKRALASDQKNKMDTSFYWRCVNQ